MHIYYIHIYIYIYINMVYISNEKTELLNRCLIFILIDKIMYVKRASKELNCQKWLFTNVKKNPIRK